MKKKALYILAPNDRFNYGDLLFAYIINHCIGNNFDKVRYISTTKSDLSELGGIPTEAYDELYLANKEKYDNYLIVAGGECLFSSWCIITSFVDKRFHNIRLFLTHLFFFRESIGLRIYNYYVNLVLPTKTKYPFTVGKNELSEFKGIYYNSVGGAGLDSVSGAKFLKQEIEREILQNVDYISVRDKYTNKAITKAGINSSLVSDCAILMSDVFTDDYLNEKLSINKLSYEKPYIFFQGNKLYLKKEAAKIALQLRKIQEQTGYSICLCPIGTALGHEDIEGFKYLIPFLNLNNVEYTIVSSLPNIFDIMWLIKMSKLYIGSSLHGIITSMSFGVPYMGYCKRKLVTYIETWEGDTNFAESVENISTTALSVMKSPIDTTKLAHQKKTVYKSFQHIVSLVNQ